LRLSIDAEDRIDFAGRRSHRSDRAEEREAVGLVIELDLMRRIDARKLAIIEKLPAAVHRSAGQALNQFPSTSLASRQIIGWPQPPGLALSGHQRIESALDPDRTLEHRYDDPAGLFKHHMSAASKPMRRPQQPVHELRPARPEAISDRVDAECSERPSLVSY
jgi:hypothetical protein